jgi:peptidoglycan/LPS O-acetylase OafA/YrhL
VTGFFILSSFLLTHNLINQVSKSANTFRSVQLIILKYFIRRFFRIYLPFLFVCTLIKGISLRFIGMYASNTNSWLSMISLQSTGFTHLWTIAPEIKYYFFIPLFVLITVKVFNKYRLAWHILTILSCFCIEYFNLFMQTTKDFELPEGHVFTTRFTVFFLGSILALIYDDIYKKEKLIQFLNRFKFIIGILSSLMYIKILKYGSGSYNHHLNEYECFFKAGFHLFIIYLLMLIGDCNFFTNIFKNSFLKLAGKFSFGIYLFHPMCLIEVNRYFSGYFVYKSEKLVFAFFVSFLTGALFFYLIEQPLIKLAKKLCLKLDY